jgi:hypothetical protein
MVCACGNMRTIPQNCGDGWEETKIAFWARPRSWEPALCHLQSIERMYNRIMGNHGGPPHQVSALSPVCCATGAHCGQ